MTDDQIKSIVDRVAAQINPVGAGSKPAQNIRAGLEPAPTTTTTSLNYRGCFSSVDDAVKASHKAFSEFQDVPLEQRKKIIERIRCLCRENVHTLAKMAHEETGLGRIEDKIAKNLLAITKTPGTEDVEPFAYTGDHGLTLLDRAPWGVIGSITPCTNPSETIINNGISMIAGGNTVVFNPHPSAKKTSTFTVDLLNQASLSAGGPANLFTTILPPTIQTAQNLMGHKDIPLLVVTGGPAVVKAAMQTGKRVVAGGPGNPPVVVDETADFEQAGSDIVKSSSLDNNIICAIEKEIIVTEKAADPLKKSLLKNGAIELSAYDAKQLEQIIVDGTHPHKDYVGKNIQFILKQIGVTVDDSVRMAITETGPTHPFAIIEMLMPVVPFIRTGTFEQAVELALMLEGGRGHTAAIHSKNIDRLHTMAVRMNTSVFVKNGMAISGLGFEGEGPTSFTIASPTGEGLTTARHFTKVRRCIVKGHFRIV